MSLILSNTAIPESDSTVFSNSFVLTVDAGEESGNGFVRGLKGSISPDDSYSGELLRALTIYYTSDGATCLLLLPGELWVQENISEIRIEGAFNGANFPSSTGAGAEAFYIKSGHSFWRWRYDPDESYFVGGNNYNCLISGFGPGLSGK